MAVPGLCLSKEVPYHSLNLYPVLGKRWRDKVVAFPMTVPDFSKGGKYLCDSPEALARLTPHVTSQEKFLCVPGPILKHSYPVPVCTERAEPAENSPARVYSADFK